MNTGIIDPSRVIKREQRQERVQSLIMKECAGMKKISDLCANPGSQGKQSQQ